MRIISIILVLAASWYFLARRENMTLNGSLTTIQHAASSSWSTFPWPGKEAEQALRTERERSAGLESSLAAVRGELRRATAATDDRSKALDLAQQTIASRDSDVQAQHAQLQSLNDQLSALKSEMMAQSDALRDQVSKERADGQASRHDGDVARERLDQANLQLAAANASQLSLQEQLRARSQTVLDEQGRSRELADRLDHLQHETADRIRALEEKLDAAHGGHAREDDAKQALGRESLADFDCNQPSMAASGPQQAGQPGPGRFRLANAVMTRVIVRYAPTSATAKAHAISLSDKLQAQGIVIQQIVEASSPMQENTVGYFYGNDESRAARIAALPDLRSGIRQYPVTDSIPRPGLIEIEIAT
jgi:hypothetical protein